MNDERTSSLEYWNERHINYDRGAIKIDDWLDRFSTVIDCCTGKILDLGCGGGNDTCYFVERGKKVTACDFSENAIENIKKNFPEVESAVCFNMLDEFPFEDNSFAIVCADLSLHYFREEDTKKILKEIQRVLVPGGHIFVRVNSIRDEKHGAGKGEEIEHHLYKYGNGTIKRFFDRDDIDCIFSDFEIDFCEEQTMGRYDEEKITYCVSMRPKMTLEQKICQMLVVVPELLSKDVNDIDSVKKTLKKYPVGGIIYFAHHLKSINQVKTMLAGVQQASKETTGLPLFLCIDEEGGVNARIAENPDLGEKNVGPMANISTYDAAYSAGATIGGYLKKFGFNVDFAPDSDVLTNPKNGIIGDRSFGTDPKVVTELSAAYSDGLHSKGILSTFKHFPGHGATEGDTHKGYAYTSKSYEDMLKDDMVPFAKAGEHNVDFVMVAHISVPTILGGDTPCTLSEKMITGVLRKEFGYEGLIITDALNMGAIVQNYDPSKACIEAVKAGNDILLMPLDIETTVYAIKKAVESGEIDESVIDAAVERILRKKVTIS